jgi:RimJ/RimL family protein N-acetyltransferase
MEWQVDLNRQMGSGVYCGHTKADNPAFIRVLEKCKFRYVGEVIDPEDGPVLRFERKAGG